MKEYGVLQYLERARVLKIIPNFWLSREYLLIQDIQLNRSEGVIWLQEGEWAIFPPLPVAAWHLCGGECAGLQVWSDFENHSIGTVLEFLDWEYTYSPRHFDDMSGKKWAVFRKNSRKWPKDKEWRYVREPAPNKWIEALLLKWLESKPEEAIQDEHSMLWFLLNGTSRAFLYDKDQLMGVNVWDNNAPYLMYRYCVTDPEEPFLNEFARLLFYQNAPDNLVIDGGCLDNPGLERFKDKLNPVKKRAVYSKIIK